MIAKLSGILVVKETTGILVIDVNGVGYEVMVSKNTLANVGDTGSKISLHIHTHVTENNMALYGFLQPVEKNLFRKLLTVSGVGPKVGLQVLSGLKPADLALAIVNQDIGRLVLIPGVGKKTAERLVVELKDKLAELAVGGLEVNEAPTTLVAEVVSALVNLGYPRVLVDRVIPQISDGGDFGDMLKKALGILSK